MTSPPSNKREQRFVLPLSILALVTTGAIWVGLFLSTFDLNDYRVQVQEQLSAQLSLPVEIGEFSFKFHETNLALNLSGLQLGNAESAIEVNVPKVLVSLRWRGLLERRIEFSRISLFEPELQFRPIVDTPDKSQPRPTNPLLIDQALLDHTRIEALEIISGSIKVKATVDAGKTSTFELSETTGTFENIGINRACNISMQGLLKLPEHGDQSQWDLQGEVILNREETGLSPEFDFKLSTGAFQLSTLKLLFAPEAEELSVSGQGQLKLHVKGSLASRVQFQAELSSEEMKILPGAAYTQPISTKQLSASGLIQQRGEQLSIKELQIKNEEAVISGELHTKRSELGTEMLLLLTEATFPMRQVKTWLPDQTGSLSPLRDGLLKQGQFNINRAQIGFYTAPTEQTSRWHLNQMQAELHNIAWQAKPGQTATIDNARFDFSHNTLEIESGYGRMGSIPMSFDGELRFGSPAPVLSLNVHGKISPPKLLAEGNLEAEAVTLTGSTSFTAHIEGPIEQLKVDLLSNLSALTLSHAAGLQLKPQSGDKLILHGSLTPQKFTIDHASLQWSLLDGHISGELPWNKLDRLQLDALFSIDDLATLAEAAPVLKDLALHGRAELNIRQNGKPWQHPPQTTVTLYDAGIKTGSSIADVSQVNGRIKIDGFNLHAEKLRAYLGQSPVTVQATINDLSAPNLELSVNAPSIRADELIFYSDKAILREITGRLELNQERLIFEQVKVKLDEGTQATVSGSIEFAPVEVNLDITSEFANIGEVIALWTDAPAGEHPQKFRQKQSAGAKPPRAKVVINAEAKRGDLYGMQFQNAKGVISPSREQLVIHPLDFSVDDGFCNAQVLVDFNGQQNTLLRISGHAEDVDALEVYRELLKQKNIVRGKLRGDFYLQGLAGAQYLPSSYGNFNVEVHDGVLHKFPTLSKVFSLLNVSQLFTLNLPDMDKEGMPFNKLQGNFQLQNGILKSNDLLIYSEAMNQSYRGQFDLINKEIDVALAIHPLGTIDKIVSHIPIAGWLLTGEDKAFLTAHFSLEGPIEDVDVDIAPIDTLSDTTLGLLKRTLGLPFKLVEDPQILWGGDASEKAQE